LTPPAIARAMVDFQAVYRDHYSAIWRFLAHLGVRRSDVPDLTHSVFLIAFRGLSGFEQRSSLRTWLCGIALNVGRDYLKSSVVRLEVLKSEVLARDLAALDDSVEALSHKRKLALAERLLDELPDEQREVFVLHELEQMTGSEIASVTGLALGTVRSRLRRARESFRRQLAELRPGEPLRHAG
jgi:RNA polymerase sigma-70 factor (ECF subfamily)